MESHISYPFLALTFCSQSPTRLPPGYEQHLVGRRPPDKRCWVAGSLVCGQFWRGVGLLGWPAGVGFHDL